MNHVQMNGFSNFKNMRQNHKIDRLGKAAIPKIKSLLEAASLPVEDLETAPVQFFGITNGEKLSALAGLEIYGADAILRSVAVKNDLQNKGLGKQLVQFAENEAREMGITRLFLLTTTAEAYFRNLAYQTFERNACPDPVRASAEFAGMCPETAVCLYKKL